MRRVQLKHLHWKKQMLNSSRVEKFGSIWKELETVEVPKEKFESLFAVKTIEIKPEGVSGQSHSVTYMVFIIVMSCS